MVQTNHTTVPSVHQARHFWRSLSGKVYHFGLISVGAAAALAYFYHRQARPAEFLRYLFRTHAAQNRASPSGPGYTAVHIPVLPHELGLIIFPPALPPIPLSCTSSSCPSINHSLQWLSRLHACHKTCKHDPMFGVHVTIGFILSLNYING